MMTLQQLRAEYPQYSEISDEELAVRYKRTHAPEMPDEEFNSQFMAHDMDAMETIRNIPSSAGAYLSDIYQAVTDPVETVKGVGRLVAGAAQKADPTGMLGEQFEPTAEAAWDQIQKQYGSWDAFKRSMQNDPVGTVGDLSLGLSGAGAGLKAARLGRIADTVRKVGANVDPIAIARNTARTATKPLIPRSAAQKVMEKGVGLRPETAAFMLEKKIPITEAGMQQFKAMKPPETFTKTSNIQQTIDTGLVDQRGRPITRTEELVKSKSVPHPEAERYARLQGDLAQALRRNPDLKGTIGDLATGSGTGGVVQGATGVPGLAAGATAATVGARLAARPKTLGALAHFLRNLKDQGYLAQYYQANPRRLRDLRNALAIAGGAQHSYPPE